MVAKIPEAYLRRIESIHRALHIPANYGALRQLTPYLESPDLIPVEGHERQHHLSPQAALQWHTMKSAAADDGIELLLISGFRSVDRQREIIERKLRKGMDLNTILTVKCRARIQPTSHRSGSRYRNPDSPEPDERLRKYRHV
jgi:hypothetical protein